MKHKIICLLIVLVSLILLLIAKKVVAPQTVTAQSVLATSSPQLESPKVLSISELIKQKANKYGVSESIMKRIIACESQGSTTVQSNYYKNKVREESYGLVQINLPAWPEISYEDAVNPSFATEFLAYHLSLGEGKLWSCYGMLSDKP